LNSQCELILIVNLAIIDVVICCAGYGTVIRNIS